MSTGRSWLQRVLGREDAAATDRRFSAARGLAQEGRHLEARAVLEEVLTRHPEHAGALGQLGHLAAAERRLDAAIDLFRRACAASPSDPDPHYGLGAALSRAGREREAEAAFRAGLALQPQSVQMLNGLAASLIELGNVNEAMALLERAAQRDPRNAGTWTRMGRAFLDQGRLPAAVDALQRAHALAPQDATVHSALLFTMNYSSDFDAGALFEAHRRFGDLQARPVAPPSVEGGGTRRLRVGYLSPDFRSHVVSVLMLPILARHDRARFEVFAYYLHTRSDRVTEGVRELADHWRECGALEAGEVASRIREDRIDILVDLAGHTLQNGLPVLALRPAPLQVTYLGYPNTTGLPSVDWRLTDAKADPPGAERVHVERLARLPRTFLCYRPGPGLDVGPLPARTTGLVTFGCFNNILKLSDPFLRLAARLLAEVPGSRLLLKDRTFAFADKRDAVRRSFVDAGIDAQRVVLRGWEPTPETHLAVYAEVDIALDSFPYNGTTTTCEALWMGVPVITLRGERHAGRVGASLLDTVGLGELVASSEEDYIRIAAALSRDLTALEALRAGMRDRLRASPLLDETGFVRSFEDCLTALWQEKLASAGRDMRSPQEVEAFWNSALDERRFGEVIQRLGEAIEAQGETASLRYMLGCALQEAGRAEEATVAYRRALELQPAHAKALNNLGSLLEVSGDAAGAVRCYDEALLADPGLAIAYSNRGNLRKANEPEVAEADLRRALELGPPRAEWHANLGDCLTLQWKLDEALVEHRAAIALAPQNARLHFGLGNVLVRLGELEAGEAALRHAIELDPAFEEAHANLLFSLHYRHGGDPLALREAHERWARTRDSTEAVRDRTPRHEGPLRVGYVSPDIRGHAVALFLAPLLASHDRDAFRIYAYSTAAQSDDVTERLRRMCDEWRDLASVPDDVAAQRIRDDGIDILVDLAGYTAGGRLPLFARKPAPVQVSWLGYPGTTGVRAIDYRFTDALADPEGESDAHATEKLWRLPQGFLCFSPAADVPVAALPAEKDGRVTFGSFNNLAKVGPEVLSTWAELLRRVPQSRLLLKAHALRSASARRRVAAALAAAGVAESRLVLLEAEARVEAHLARYGEVDIALDTFPYAGTTTTCEALWMGVPVVTLRGNSHVSRVGASLLEHAGLPELVGASREHYLEIAQSLAADLPRLREMRRTLRERLKASKVMDRAGFARSVEAAYRAMCGGEALRLHVGGKEVRPGWKILNAQAGPGVDYVGDCADLGRFADGSVEEIYASHVLEHLGYQSALPRALKEFHRVLRPGGVARISVPDFERLARLFLDPASTLDDRYVCMRMVFGGQVDEFDYHRVGLSEEFLTQYLLQAGFSRVERVEQFGLFTDASRLGLRGQPISLNVVAHK
ncbi:MAG TPA: tetratricopeptide repeat protein [Burkholderiales bacterium]|nr:tetratricopeptide repeat protein [Burkholderiales bacterium]